MKHKLTYFIVMLLGMLVVSSCEKIGYIFHKDGMKVMEGYVYTSTNETGKNNIVIFKQDGAGKLIYKAKVASGGAGKGMGLGSQGSLVMDKYHKWIYTVNAGDNTISSFAIAEDGGLSLNQTISSGGQMPISLTVHGNWLYVANSGGNICGFQIAANGYLSKIEGSVQPLSSPQAGPAEILFRPDGSMLVVTEKMTNMISTFLVNGEGVAKTPVVHPAYATTPFGFVFAGNDHLIITDAFGGAAGASVVTSIALGNGKLNLKSYVPLNQAAACWVVLSKDQDYAFVTNTQSNSISALSVKSNGKVELLDSIAGKTGKEPTDICLSGNYEYVYNLNQMSGSISQFRMLSNGRLNHIGEVSGLTLFSAGLVAF